MHSAADHAMMARALRLAERGLYTTSPNPRVGCVIVRDGRIVGEGAHLKAGEPHAEVHALRQAGALAAGADVYVTLEPCSHHGRTPPCANALVAAGVKRVIAAMQDPNPLVAGNGLHYLASHGIETSSGLMQAEAQALNPGFISRMMRQRPYVRSKIAASLDGKTAMANGVSQWITGRPARQDVQHWRAQSCAILTGVDTVIADNPLLNVRNLETGELMGRQPLRVVVDSRLRIPPQAAILSSNTLIVHAEAEDSRMAAIAASGAELLQLPNAAGQVDLDGLLQQLALRGINEVLVEAGAVLNGALLAQQLIDEFIFYQAPMLLGAEARGLFAGSAPFSTMSEAIRLHIVDLRQLGDDIRIRARPVLRQEE